MFYAQPAVLAQDTVREAAAGSINRIRSQMEDFIIVWSLIAWIGHLVLEACWMVSGSLDLGRFSTSRDVKFNSTTKGDEP